MIEKTKIEMKPTGIVRRIDDLGRIVIPKEFRRELQIREGDPLELYFDKGNKLVCFQKYEPLDYFDINKVKSTINVFNVNYAIYSNSTKLVFKTDNSEFPETLLELSENHIRKPIYKDLIETDPIFYLVFDETLTNNSDIDKIYKIIKVLVAGEVI